jgi:hypothetical protein
MNMVKQNRKFPFTKLAVESWRFSRKTICSSRVPVITKKPLSNLTNDKGFLNCSSSGDSMELGVVNCIEMHPISHNSTHRPSQSRFRFQQYCEIVQYDAMLCNVCSSPVPVGSFLIVLKHD